MTHLLIASRRRQPSHPAGREFKERIVASGAAITTARGAVDRSDMRRPGIKPFPLRAGWGILVVADPLVPSPAGSGREAFMNSSTFDARPRYALRSVALALAAVLTVAPAVIGQQRPQFGTRVDVIQFQVRVTDGAGGSVTGLQATDFQLRVNGSEREITTAYEVNVMEDGAPAAGAQQMPAAAWRQWVLFFDAAFNSPRGVVAAQEAARNFVQTQARDQDLIAVATFSLVRGAELVVPPTRDHEQVLLAIGGLGLNSATRAVDRAGFLAHTINEGGIAGAAGDGQGAVAAATVVEEAIRQVNGLEVNQYAAVVEQYAGQLGSLGGMLRTIRGRKHVVYFSQGFADSVLSGQSLDELSATSAAIQANPGEAIAQSSAEARFGSSELRSELDDALAIFRSADAVIHVVDSSGLGGGRDTSNLRSMETTRGEFSARGGSRGALTSLADATGGSLYWESNDVSAALADIEQKNRSYYVLAFPRQPGDDDVLQLEVAVSQAGAHVDAPGQLAAPVDFDSMSDVEKQIQLAEFVSKAIVANDMNFEVSTAAFYGDGETARLPVVIEVPWAQLEELADAGDDERVELEIYSYALDENDSMVDLSNQEVSLNIGRMRDSRAAGLPFRYYDLLWARPGQRRVRVILRDKELGRISAITTAPTLVPRHASGDMAMAGPVPVDWEHPGLLMRGFDASKPPPHKADGPVGFPFAVGDNEVTPAAGSSGGPGSEHYAYFVAYNLGADANGQAQTNVAMTLQSPMGQFIQPPQSMVASYYDEATTATHMIAKATIPPNLPPGMYRLGVMLNDQIKGQQAQGSFPIWVEAQ